MKVPMRPLEVEELLALSRSPATLRAYKSDWRHYCAWCEGRNFNPLEVPPERVAEYLADCTGQVSPRTLARRVAAIAAAYREHDRVLDRRHPMISGVLMGYRRYAGMAPVAAKDALTLEDVEAIVATLPQDLRGLRDSAVLLVGFHAAARRSELASLCCEDLVYRQGGILLRVVRSKEDQEGEGQIKALRTRSEGACPVRALKRWLIAGEIGEGPVFRRIDRHGKVAPQGVSGRAISEVVKRAVRHYGEVQGWRQCRIDEKVAAVGGHSLRAGYVTSAASAGHNDHWIMAHTGHKRRDTIRHYIRSGRLLSDDGSVGRDL